MTSGAKRSFFTKPAWAAPTTSKPSEKESSVFGRTDIYRDILQAEQEKKKKAAKPKQKTGKQEREEPETKRRRVSIEPAEPQEKSDFESDNDRTHSPANVKKENGPGRPGTRSTPRKDKLPSVGIGQSRNIYKSPAEQESPRRKVVVLQDGDEESEDDLVIWTPPPSKVGSSSASKRKTEPPSEDEESEEEEDAYVRELKAKAREKARLQQPSIERDRSNTPLRASSAASERSRHLSVDKPLSRPTSSDSAQGYGRATPASEQEDDPHVRIMIRSEIPNTQALIVKRKASQPLKQVKEFWCKRWQLDDKTTRKVFFTWRGTRLFDSTTMRGILLKLKTEYREKSASLGLTDDEFDEGVDQDKDPSHGNILIDAMTPELYEEQQRQKAREQSQSQREQEQEDEEHTATPAPESDGSIVIRLVAQNLEPMQLRVRPHTTIAKITRGFVATRKIDEGKTAYLIFDGERLDPEKTVEDIELEDEDEVEVSIR
ncbi:hypothetical protein PV08_04661 [Exophiala spinifera]|uniref:Ubiquitin-like domain-containing protein n=1 Tax=Exophiala spinifera TaxID=91928 RepID=A0A0D1ZXW2_9EURO|nr:uncharacterized protein PV08_04661 [Exophiala spinifera]KIW17467.1 hypothetical protein PV08_04661 [Exophiala spinifera]